MKKKLIILILFLMIYIPVYADAATVSVSLSCPSSAKASSTVSCTVSAKSNGSNLKGLQANIKVSNGTYSSFNLNSNWTSYSNSASGFSLSRNSATTNLDTVGVLKLKMPASGNLSISLTNVTGSDSNYVTLNGNSPSKTIRVQSTINTLSSLKISTGTLSPAFNQNTTKYTSTVNASSITISATKTDSKSTISGTGTKSLNYGTNTFNIVVTSESGAKKTYTLTITRPDNRSTNNNLKSLSTDTGTISFNKNTTNYTLDVDSNVTSIKLNATLEDTKSSFVNGYGPRTVNLNYGKNSFQIKVKAENQSIKTYTININRKDDRSSNNYLKELTLSSGDITFNKNNLEYSTTVYYDVEKINVEAIPEDSKATVQINNPDLLVGNNIITIIVTSENKQTRTYKINVTRLSEDQKMSDNNNISELKILGHDINFKSDTLEYDLTIKDEYALVFEISLEDQKASYKIEGNKELKDGSVIKVISTSESGQEKEYKFNINKEVEEQKSTNVFIYIIIGFISGVIITMIIGKFKKKKDNKNKINIDNNTNTNYYQNPHPNSNNSMNN